MKSIIDKINSYGNINAYSYDEIKRGIEMFDRNKISDWYYNSDDAVCESSEELGYVVTALARAGYFVFVEDTSSHNKTRYTVSFHKIPEEEYV